MSSENPFAVSSGSIGDRSVVDRDASLCEVSPRTLQLLDQTRPWVQLIGVLMWIATVLMVIGGAIGFIVGLATNNLIAAGMSGMYLLIAAIYWALARSLTGYSKGINALKASESLSDLETALAAQKTFWKITGIMTVIFVVVYLGAIVAVAGTAGFMAASGRA